MADLSIGGVVPSAITIGGVEVQKVTVAGVDVWVPPVTLSVPVAMLTDAVPTSTQNTVQAFTTDGLEAGDMILKICSSDAGKVFTTESGWTKVDESTGDPVLHIEGKIWDGNPMNAPVAYLTDNTYYEDIAVVILCLRGVDPTFANIQESNLTTSSGPSLDLPSWTPTGGSQPRVWITVMTMKEKAFSTFPDGWTTAVATTGTAAGSATVGVMVRIEDAASMNPGSVGLSGSITGTLIKGKQYAIGAA